MEIPLIVYILWWVLLIVAVAVVLPILVYLLHRTLNAARGIEHYFGRALDAGLGIAGNTANVAALEDTIAVAGGILETAAQIDEHAATIEQVFTARRGAGASS